MDCSPPGPSIHGIFQARVLEWGAIIGHDKNWSEPSRSKMTEDSASSETGASLYTHCNTLAPKWHSHQYMTVPKLTIKRQKVGDGPWDRIILPPISPWNYSACKNQPCHILRLPHLLKWPTLCPWSVFVSKKKSFLTYHFVSHWILSLMRHRELELH